MLFLNGQGYAVGPSVIYQDNKSAILLENNGKRSSGPRTRHLKIRYFFITDRVNMGDVVVEYCPTHEMVADILTKPLQESAFLPFTFDNNVQDVFHIHRPNGETRDFIRSDRGLYYMRAHPPSLGTNLLIQTLSDNKQNFTACMIARADQARCLQNTIGRPPTQRLLEIIDKCMLPNCPITREDVIIAEQIYGPNLGGLKGRTTRTSSPKSDGIAVTGVPPEILKYHQNVTLSIDFMFINGIPFLVTISKGIKFGTITHIQNQKLDTIRIALERISSMYSACGSCVTLIKADNEFECMRQSLQSINVGLNVTAQDEHVPEVKRYIETIKERTRATYAMLPYQHLPGRLTVELVMSQVYWLNSFPANDGVSNHLSPRYRDRD
jgi:hypothetical protein